MYYLFNGHWCPGPADEFTARPVWAEDTHSRAASQQVSIYLYFHEETPCGLVVFVCATPPPPPTRRRHRGFPCNRARLSRQPRALQRIFELCIPRNHTARPCSQFPYSYICILWAIYIFPGLVHLFCCHAVSLLGIFFSNFRYSFFTVFGEIIC